MSITNIIYIIIYSILNSVIITFMMTYISEKHIKTKYTYITSLISLSTIFLSFVLINIFKDSLFIVAVLILGLIIILNLKFNYKLKMVNSIVIGFSNFILFFITKLIIYLLVFYITNLNYQTIITNNLYLILLDFVQLVLIVFSSFTGKYLISNFKKLKYILKNISNKILIILLTVLAICTLPQLLIFLFSEYEYPHILVIINIFQILLICLVIFFTLKQTVEKDKAKSDLITIQLHNKTMSGMIDGIRTLKHDYNNIIQSFNGYLATKQYDKLQAHVNKILKECNIINNLGVIDPKIFNEPAIYGIVGSKYLLITKDDIQMDLDIVTNIKEINFSMPELSRILGILLDNAYEATKDIKNPYVCLQMRYDNRKCADIIRIINTYDTSKNLNLENIYNKGFSSKKIKSGIGLWEVKNIVNRVQHAQIYATIEKGKFVQNLIIERN